MISSRRNLLGHVRGFFERELAHCCNWDSVKVAPPIAAPDKIEINGRLRRNPQKFLEQVRVEFLDGRFSIEVKSPAEEGPLGWIRAYHGTGLIGEGVLDVSTWARIGAAVRENFHGR